MSYTDRGQLPCTDLTHCLVLTKFCRVRDWLHGIRAAEPDKETEAVLTKEHLTEAERYRTVYQLITGHREEGGAEIIPKQGQWENVESIFPLHDKAWDKQWIKQWSTTTFLKAEDLDNIRDRLGEKVIPIK